MPAHNEEGNIEPLLAAFQEVFRAARLRAEVILVNDGSTDGTEQKMTEAVRRYPFLRLAKNRVRMGLTASLVKGFAQARGRILAFFPADLQFHPSELPKMIAEIENGADMVCGKKIGSYGKWLVSWIYNLLTRLLFPKLKVTDMNSIKAFTREVYNDFPALREGWHRYLAAFAAARDYNVREIPVTLHNRHSGTSKFSGSGRIVKGLTDLIAVKFQVSVFGDPMHLFGKVSLVFFFIGFIFALVAFYDRFILGSGYRPLLYVVIFFELAALVTFVMGIITEALVYLRDSLNELTERNARLETQLERISAGLSRLGTSVSERRDDRPGADQRRSRNQRRRGRQRQPDQQRGETQGERQGAFSLDEPQQVGDDTGSADRE